MNRKIDCEMILHIQPPSECEIIIEWCVAEEVEINLYSESVYFVNKYINVYNLKVWNLNSPAVPGK